MIKQITLKNYRCFNEHKIEFKDVSIVVGKNNAGKSTLIEALRIVALVTNRYKHLPYKSAPNWMEGGKSIFGISPSLKGLEFSFRNIYHHYGEPPAEINVVFLNLTKINVFIGGENEIYAILYDNSGKIIRNKSEAVLCELPEINILPQIGPIKQREELLEPEYVKSNISSNLASIHFRNQLQYFPEYFEEFVNLSQETWVDLRIRKFEKGSKLTNDVPTLLVQDGSFVSEIGWMGHGLQMWLQTMWFIARCNSNSTVILDEPDVYLHADIQRKLIRFLKDRFKQILIATHSIEIISEVFPENILIINKDNSKSKYASNLPAVQEIISRIGSVHNLELIRYWTSKKFLIVEGDVDDTKILKIFQDKIYPTSSEPFDILPKTYVEGWGGWQRVVGCHSVVKEQNIKTYCIFDSDYHLDNDKRSRYEEASRLGINLHIWKRKEIENYLLIPSAIFRLIEKSKRKGSPTINALISKIDEILDNLKDELIDKFASEIQMANRGQMASTFNKKAREIVDGNWKDRNSKFNIAPGKEIIQSLSGWSKENYGVSFNKFQIAGEMTRTEVDDELVNVVKNIELNQDFPVKIFS